MPILHPTVENPDELLAWPGPEGPINRIQIERSDTGAGAGYANITSLTITAATRFYTFYDVAGDTADWYRWYFSNAANTFPSSANRVYSPEQQPGPEAGFLASLADVKLQMRSDAGAADIADDDLLLSFMAQMTTEISSYCERRFVRSPLAGTSTFLFDVGVNSRRLRIPQGIAQMTQLEVATTSQPESGGVFTIVPAADWFLRPEAAQRTYGWPATEVWITDLPSGSLASFHRGHNTVRATMALGFVTPPVDVAGVFINAVVRHFMGRGSGVLQAVGSESFGAGRLLRWVSPEERETLDRYRAR